MGRRSGGVGGGIVAVMVAVMLLENCTTAQIYTCWGGCYNECFLSSTKTRPERFFCYYQCLNSCVPRTAADYGHYCQIGCSLAQCTSLRYTDGERMDKCFSSCSNLCQRI